MRCPRCSQPTHDFSAPCPHCQFEGDSAVLEELAHLEWLLAELPVWPAITSAERQFVVTTRRRTIAQARALRIKLGLLLGEEAAKSAWPQLYVREATGKLLDQWRAQGLLNETQAQTIGTELNGEIVSLRQKLEGYPPGPPPAQDNQRLVFVGAQLQMLEAWEQRTLFAGTSAAERARAPLTEERTRLEIKLGLRTVSRPLVATASIAPVQASSDIARVIIPPRPPSPPPPPTPPLRDRFWRTLLSERTLQALLFLGIFLLFAAAVSFVIIGWETFPAILRVAIPTGFTTLFFALGWYVRTRTQLYRSGIALSAIASLLIPIDFYTVYANFDISPEFAPSFWLLTSLLCLGAYMLITRIVGSRFFGYLVGAAAGSTALSLVEIAHQAFGLSLDWRPAVLALLAGVFVLVAAAIQKTTDEPVTLGSAAEVGEKVGDGRRSTEETSGQARPEESTPPALTPSSSTTETREEARPELVTTSSGAGSLAGMLRMRSRADVERGLAFAFAEPLRNLALLGVAILMLLTFGSRYIERHDVDTLHSSLALTWFVGALIFGWGSIYYRSRGLGVVAAITLPVATYLAQGSLFAQAHINPAWHAFGWALLVPIYFYTSHRLRAQSADLVLRAHGRTAGGWGVVLLVVAALWSLLDSTSSAASHTVLALAIILAARWWQQPRWLYAASLFAFSAATFSMSQLGVPLAQMGVGWATLAIAHVLVALRLGESQATSRAFAHPVVVAGYLCAALAVVPALLPYNADLFIYTLANWLVLVAWGARLAHVGQAGFAHATADGGSPTVEDGVQANATIKTTRGKPRFMILRQASFHWLTAIPLPVWLWAVIARRGPLDAMLPLVMAALAWLMVALSIRLAQVRHAYRFPWYVVGLLVSLVAVGAAYLIAPDGPTLAAVILSAGLLYFADATLNRQSPELLAGGLFTAWGFGLLLERLRIDYDTGTLALVLLVALYILGGLAVTRRRSPLYSQAFLSPLFASAHIVTTAVLLRVYLHPLYAVLYRVPWSDELLLWGAACQLLLGVVYAAYAWGTFKRHWAYVAVWLATAGGGFLALLYSTGSGSLAAKTALGAIVFIVAERILHDLRRRGNDLETRAGRRLTDWQRAVVRSAWRLFREPLLVTGWLVSLAAIANALLRNLLLLGAGRTPQTWAAIGLLVIVGLYALSARLFRQERFLWFAAVLLFVPWTILTNLGFFVAGAPAVPTFAVSWLTLAWLLVLAGLGLAWFLNRNGGDRTQGDSNTKVPLRWGSPLPGEAYARPLKVVAHVIVPGALLWGMFDVDTSRITFIMAIGFYGLAAVQDFATSLARPIALPTRRQLLHATRFFYPWLALMPLWCLYLLAWLVPTARQELYGLLLLSFGPLGLLTGQWLELISSQAASSPAERASVARAHGLPAYLTGYVSAIVGTLLIAHIQPLLALVLLLDAALAVASARVFRQPLWLYLVAALTPLALGIALDQAAMPFNRYGWWLLALAAVYCALAWTLRRMRQTAYSIPLLIAGFALIALGLPPSSRDQDGALYGYAAAALLYALNAFWLRQPLLLSASGALILVPYAILLRRSPLFPEQYGFALLPGAVVALACGILLDRAFGAVKNFPWGDLRLWPRAFVERWLTWWALPCYALGFGLAALSPLFVGFRSDYGALNFLLLVPIFVWAIYAFRLRVWLVLAAGATQLSWLFYLAALGWGGFPVELAVRFVPLTMLTAAIALGVQRQRKESSPLTIDPDNLWRGWSQTLYFIIFLDIFAAQGLALQGTWAGALVSLSHALLLGVLASAWAAWWLPYVCVLFGIAAYQQWLSTLGGGDIEGWPVALSYLALAYGGAGFALRFSRMAYDRAAVATPRVSRARAMSALWEAPLVRMALIFALAILALTTFLGIDLIGWTIRALFGTPVRQLVRLPVAQMWVGVFSLLGLLYVAAAAAYQRMRLGYVAIGMLLLAWSVHAFYVQQWDDAQRVQWYAMPAGLYLLAVAYLEWQRGQRDLARWLDYAAVLLMLGSLFWQTLLYGWQFALLLGAEGFAAFWWGSARRLRRFLYIGMLAVVLATLAQLLNALQSVNQWIVFGLIGLVVVLAAVAIERQLESIKAWRETIEAWE